MALESFGVIRMAFTPEAIMFCTSVTWLSLSPSAFPAVLVIVASFFFVSVFAFGVPACSHQRGSLLVGLGLRGRAHRDEVRVRVCLRDQTDLDVVAAATA